MAIAYSANYLKNQIETASREQLLIMFYDGAIRFVSASIQAIEDNDFERRTCNINKASAIISELSATLDHRIGGQIAADLEALYEFMNHELSAANARNDRTPLEVVKNILSELREAWIEAIKTVKQQHSPLSADNHATSSLSIAW